MKFLLGTLLALLLFFSVSAQETVRIMSYNIHNGAGLDKKVEKCTTVHTKLINGIVEHRTECAGRLREIVGVVSADRHCPCPP